MILLMVCLGAAVGAPARYLTDRAIQSRHDSVFPWGTFTVNVVGFHLVLDGGLLTAGAVLGNIMLLINLYFLWTRRREYVPLLAPTS